MEQLLENTRHQLVQFLKLWTIEATGEQQIVITSTHVTFESQGEQQTTPIKDLCQDNFEPILKKCKDDLMRAGINIIPSRNT